MTSAKEFRQAIEQTVPHMDGELPEVYGLTLESDGTHLFVVATDRYTIAVSRLPAADAIPWKAMLGWSGVKRLQASLGLLGGDITFDHDQERNSLRLVCGNTSLGLPTVNPSGRPGSADGDGFFDWRLVIRRQFQKPPAELSVEMTLKYLARWQHLGDRAMFWATGDHKPVMVIADDFIGGQMPVSRGVGLERERLERVESWLPIVGRHAHYAGVDYDMSQTYLDRDGDPWEFVRHDPVTGPLMNICGLDGGEFTLADLVDAFGPLRVTA